MAIDDDAIRGPCDAVCRTASVPGRTAPVVEATGGRLRQDVGAWYRIRPIG